MRVDFGAHCALVGRWIADRDVVADLIDRTLLAVAPPVGGRTGRTDFDDLLTKCFFGLTLPRELVRLKGQLASAHVAGGFEPLNLEARANELDPLVLVARAHSQWASHHRPGRSGRLTFADSIVAVSVLRSLEYLSLCVWDDGVEHAAARLALVQGLLDRLNEGAGRIRLVRDARWLIHTAQGPVTRHLEPYFRVAEQITGSFDAGARREIHAAGAKLAGGHLRSQLAYRMARTGRPIDDPQNLAITRNSNAMDGALLVGDLVPLLAAYADAVSSGRSEERLALADAILQGLSADPDLLVTRLDLVPPNLMVEDVFVVRDAAGRVSFTEAGQRHERALAEYAQRLGASAAALLDDAHRLDPARGLYSPFSITYGFVADFLANMAQGPLDRLPVTDLSLEDFFDGHTRLDEKCDRAQAWAGLPRRLGEAEHFSHQRDWGGEIFRRVTTALTARAARPTEPNASGRRSARVVVSVGASDLGANDSAGPSSGPELADEHCFTSDMSWALAGTWTGVPKVDMLADRKEGRYVASVEVDGHWFAVSKVLFTLVVGEGRDARLTSVPAPLVDGLAIACRELVERVE